MLTRAKYRALTVARREAKRLQKARLADSATAEVRVVTPTRQQRFSLSTLSARQAREREVKSILAAQRSPVSATADPRRRPVPAVSLTALSTAPHAHRVSATLDKLADKRREELYRARATPLLRRPDVALDDNVLDVPAVGSTNGANVRAVRELIAAGVKPVPLDTREHRVISERICLASHLSASFDRDTTFTDPGEWARRVCQMKLSAEKSTL